MKDARGPRPLTGLRLAMMGLLTLAALAALLVLYDVRFNQGDLWFSPLSDVANQKGMTILLLFAEAFAVVAMLLLLLIRPRRPFVDEEWISTGGTHVGAEGTRVQIGCPGCGTVFEKPLEAVDEPHEQDFRCPNCGRAGRLGAGLQKAVKVRESTCGTCGRRFQAYRDTAECPHCHAPQP